MGISIHTMTYEDVNVDILSNNFAIAVSRAEGRDFAVVNEIFATIFKDITTPAKLQALVTSKTENKTVIKKNDGYWEMLEIRLNKTDTAHLLKNISYEMLILKKLKEQLKELTDTGTLYSGILNKALPIGVLIMDDDYNVVFANTTLKRFFHIPPKAELTRCYNYVKELKPCNDCLLNSFRKNRRKNKKSFTIDGGKVIITAEMHPLEDKYIVIFRDTTREINLIKEIKKQQEELEKANKMISEQHDILKRLSNINIRIGQLKDLEAILEVVIDSIIDTFVSPKGAILLINRAGQIVNAHFTGMITPSERERLIKNVSAPGSVPKKELARYVIMDMADEGQLNGRVFLYRPEKTVDSSTLELFLMQVDIYLENLRLQGQLEEVAHTDSLTGVFNRYYFDRQFIKEKNQSLRFGQPLSLLVVDVNGLKAVNDRLGHEAGDALVKETAMLLTRETGISNSICSIYRVGGDEFIVLIPNCPEECLKRMEETFKKGQLKCTAQFNDEELPVRFSLGGACSAETVHDKLKDTADKRMYRDKEEFYKNHKKYR